MPWFLLWAGSCLLVFSTPFTTQQMQSYTFRFKNEITDSWACSTTNTAVAVVLNTWLPPPEGQQAHEKISFKLHVPMGSPSCGGDVVVYVFDINQQSLPTPFYSVLLSVSVFMALSTVFHCMNSPDNSPFSHSVLLVLFLPYWSFQLCISLWKSPSALI